MYRRVGQLVDRDPVDLARRAAIAAAQPGTEPGDRHVGADRGERAGQRRVAVSGEQRDVRARSAPARRDRARDVGRRTGSGSGEQRRRLGADHGHDAPGAIDERLRPGQRRGDRREPDGRRACEREMEHRRRRDRVVARASRVGRTELRHRASARTLRRVSAEPWRLLPIRLGPDPPHAQPLSTRPSVRLRRIAHDDAVASRRFDCHAMSSHERLDHWRTSLDSVEALRRAWPRSPTRRRTPSHAG